MKRSIVLSLPLQLVFPATRLALINYAAKTDSKVGNTKADKVLTQICAF